MTTSTVTWESGAAAGGTASLVEAAIDDLLIVSSEAD